MHIERNAFERNSGRTYKDLRDICMGCTDCSGPCRMLIELSQLPDIVLAKGEARR